MIEGAAAAEIHCLRRLRGRGRRHLRGRGREPCRKHPQLRARLEVREQTGIWYEPESGRVVVGLLVPRG